MLSFKLLVLFSALMAIACGQSLPLLIPVSTGVDGPGPADFLYSSAFKKEVGGVGVWITQLTSHTTDNITWTFTTLNLGGTFVVPTPFSFTVRGGFNAPFDTESVFVIDDPTPTSFNNYKAFDLKLANIINSKLHFRRGPAPYFQALGEIVPYVGDAPDVTVQDVSTFLYPLSVCAYYGLTSHCGGYFANAGNVPLQNLQLLTIFSYVLQNAANPSLYALLQPLTNIVFLGKIYSYEIGDQVALGLS